jgi:hypothetical protein
MATEVVTNEIPNDCKMAAEAVPKKIRNDCNMATEAIPHKILTDACDMAPKLVPNEMEYRRAGGCTRSHLPGAYYTTSKILSDFPIGNSVSWRHPRNYVLP